VHYQPTLHFLVVLSTLLLLVAVVVDQTEVAEEVPVDIVPLSLEIPLVVVVVQKHLFLYQLHQVLTQ
jgi:hypothetical protein